jgi:uncharacterized protein (TIGR02145 family)
MNKYLFLFALISPILFAGCKKDDFDPVLFELVEIKHLTHCSVQVIFDISSLGTYGREGVGICCSEHDNPTLEDEVWGQYRRNDSIYNRCYIFLSGLKPGTQYYMKIFNDGHNYNTNTRLYQYSKVFQIKTLPVNNFTDKRDYKTYQIMEFGNQTWMVENLAFNAGMGSYGYDDPIKDSIYGRLYTYECALNACPSGWHLPSDQEWQQLETELGLEENQLNLIGNRGDSIRIIMKEPGYRTWTVNRPSTNASGFTALPGGKFIPSLNKIDGLYRYGFYLSSTINPDKQIVYSRLFDYDFNGITRQLQSLDEGFSVRCVKD